MASGTFHAAMVLDAPGPIASSPLHAREMTDVEPGNGELVLRVGACAVCRTDLQLCEGDLPAHALPVVPGHQIVGTVEAVGANVRGWTTGDRAGVAWLAGACGECAECRAGRENLCARAAFTGWDRDGGYATQARVRADFALRIPPSFTDVDAAPLLCGGVIGYRALRRAGVGPESPGMRVGLYGFGASALLALQVARFWKCRVFVATRSEEEQTRARALGAEWAGGYDDTPPEPLDGAVTFAPVGSVVHRALKAVGRGATVAINAIHLDGLPAMPYADLWWERSLASVANFTRDDARAFLQLAAEIPIRTEHETHRLEEANVALARLAAGQVRGAAVLIPG
jgi:propanol-preferring alcohol dehydrogenase